MPTEQTSHLLYGLTNGLNWGNRLGQFRVQEKREIFAMITGNSNTGVHNFVRDNFTDSRMDWLEKSFNINRYYQCFLLLAAPDTIRPVDTVVDPLNIFQTKLFMEKIICTF